MRLYDITFEVCMNKQALKLKKKRRAEREREKEQYINKIWNEMSKVNTDNGLPQFKKTKEQMLKVYKATKQMDSEIIKKTAIITLVCSLFTLLYSYEFYKEDLLRYSRKLKNFIIDFAKTNKSASNLIEEIENDYDVEIHNKCKKLPALKTNEFNIYSMEDTIITSTVDNLPFFIAINAYTFMNELAYTNNLSWNS